MPDENTTQTVTDNTDTGSEQQQINDPSLATSAIDGQQTETQTTTATEGEADAKPELVDSQFEFTMPEGVEVDKDGVDNLKNFLAEKGFTKEAGQQIFDYMLEARQKALDVQMKEAQARKDTQAREEETIRKDPDIGGVNYEKVQEAVDRITLKYGDEEFQKTVVDAGLKSDAQFLKFINNLNKALSEDDVLTTSQSMNGSQRRLTIEEEAKRDYGDVVRHIK